MTKVTSVFSFFFFFAFFSFLAVHHAHMKTPSQSREIASWGQIERPWYDASYKL